MVGLFCLGSVEGHSTEGRINKDFLKESPPAISKKPATAPAATPSQEILKAARVAQEVAEEAQFEMMKTDSKVFKKEFDRVMKRSRENIQTLNKKVCK